VPADTDTRYLADTPLGMAPWSPGG
jgi:hypothetical protein